MRSVSPVAALVVLAVVVSACGGSSSSTTPTGPTTNTTPPPAASTFTLGGLVIDDAAQIVSGAVVTILDGPNANRTAATDGSGRYSFTGLTSSGFSVQIRRDGYNDAVRSVTLTSNTVLDVTLVRARINLSGTLTGTFAYTFRPTGQRIQWPMTATITQNGTAITGTLRISATTNTANDWTGSLNGTLSSLNSPAQYSGALTISAGINTGTGRCNGSRSNVSGSATGTSLTVSAPGLWAWVECVDDREDIVITLRR